VLYHAKLDPHRAMNSLSDAEIRRLRTKIAHVVKTAVAADANKGKLPRTWLFHHRWGKVAGATTAKGEAIHHTEIGGRTTAWVPAVQR
ncbi:MAG: hypothetical protein AAGA56_06455, partial [Myxococcota bacterium]